MRLSILLTIYLAPILSSGQTRTITGKVIDEYEMATIPGARIQNSDTVELGRTDMNGTFRMELANGTDELLISFVGMEWTSIKVPANCDDLEVIMMVSVIYDFVTVGAVNRKRFRRFKRLKDKHREAFEKGIFKSKKPCVTYTYSKH